jgi:long-chain acyl-CoA synthetase
MNPVMTEEITAPEIEVLAAAAPALGVPGNLGEMLLAAAEQHSGTALQFPQADQTITISYPELGAIVTDIARGLIALGIEPDDRVAILGSTSADWVLADYGALCAGAVVTPIYHTNSPDECAYVLEHSGARLVFCEDPDQAAKIAQIRHRCPDLEYVVLFHGLARDSIALSELLDRASESSANAVRLRLAQTAPDDVATLVYTSGTTGPPKGCMLTHRNLLETTRMYVEQLGINEDHTLYQFLPLAHVLARVAQAVVLRAGARAVFWGGDPKLIIEEVSALGPTHFPAVPRIYEKVHGVVIGQVQDGSAVKRALFEWALGLGRAARSSARGGQPLSAWQTLQYRIADRLVLRKVRRAFGEDLQIALVGAAPVARELLEFFDACGVLVLEGYGMTESSAAATLNTEREVRFGTVGKPLPGTEIAVAEDGEILIKGPHVFTGYYRDPDATAETLSADGWLRSGDLGMVTDEGFVAITGRKKDLIITSNGKNITPVNIESALRESRYITEAVVFGDNRPYLVAALTLDPDEAGKLAERLGIPADGAAIAADARIRAEVQKEIDAANQHLARIEQIKRFAILDRDLTQADGELTPTLKVKRAFVYEKYADVFAGLYEEGGRS